MTVTLTRLALLLLLSSGCGFPRGTVLIPDGHVGWVRIHYVETGAPSLQQEHEKYLIVVDPSGKAHTSSDSEAGYGSDQYYYVSSNRARYPSAT